MKINVCVTEILSRIITIDVDSEDKAINTVEDMYKNGEIVLDYSDFDGNVIIEKELDNLNSKKDSLTNKLIEYLIKDEEKHYEESNKPSEHIYLTLLELQKHIN